MKKLLMPGLIALFILASLATARAETYNGVNIYRVAPDSVFIGQEAWITLVLENSAGGQKTITINESISGDADFNQSEAQYIQTAYGEKLWYYSWQIILASGENTSVAYWIAPSAAGTYVIPPASVIINGQTFRLKSHSMEVRCNANKDCEPGENYLNCPEDCGTGGSDSICDAASDGKCDPDCEQAADPDCKTFSQSGEQPQGWPNAFIIIGILITIAVAFAAVKFSKK
jgi:hypothetical protein